MASEKKVRVVLTSIYSDGKENPGPGTVLELGASEAEHLISAGGAKPYEPEAAAD